MSNNDPLVIATPAVRVLDFGIFEPKPSQFSTTGNEKFTLRILLDKSTPEHMECVQAIETAEQLAISERWKNPPPGLRYALVDGDATDSKTGQRLHSDLYKNTYFLTAKSSNRPTLYVGRQKRVAEDGDFYSGAECIVVFKLFSYDNQSRGVSAGLNLVWKVANGTRIASGNGEAELAAAGIAKGVKFDDNLDDRTTALNDAAA